MRQLKVRHPNAEFLVLWDGKAKWRWDLLPEYKSKRNQNPKQVAEKEAYQKQIPFIKKALTHIGITQMLSDEHEADDLAGIMVSRLLKKSPDTKIRLITGDQDWIQLIREGVTWQDIRVEDRVINMKNMFEKTGYKTPISFLNGKALHGDTSDCISGVGGIGETGAPLFIAEHGSVRNFWDKCDKGTYKPKNKAERSLWLGVSEKTKDEWESDFYYHHDDSLDDEANDKECKRQLRKHMDAYIGQGRLLFGRNLTLMQLIKPKPLNKDLTTITKGKFDKEAFSELCGEFAFLSILKNVDNFLSPFHKTTGA